jgi:hypothetical protein
MYVCMYISGNGREILKKANLPLGILFATLFFTVTSVMRKQIHSACSNNRNAVRVHRLFLGAFVKLRKGTVSVVTSVRPQGRTRLPLNGFLGNFML